MITNICRLYLKEISVKTGIISPLLGAAAALALLPTPSSFAGTLLNGHEWDYVYYGSDIPIAGDANWTVFKGSTTSPATHSGSALVMNTSAALIQQVYYTSTQWNPSTVTGVASVEFRMSLGGVLAGSANDNVIAFTVSYGTRGTAFYLGNNGLTLFPGSGAPLVTGFDPTVAHTYRVIFDTTNATFSLDIDGIRKVSDHALLSGWGGNVLRIGDSSSSVGGIMRYEYIAWDNAAAPIPEPAVAFLLPAALGAVVLSRSRRRRSIFDA